jgi:hypothetical protein
MDESGTVAGEEDNRGREFLGFPPGGLLGASAVM